MRAAPALLLFLAGCQGRTPEPPARDPATVVSPATVSIAGHATYAERVKMPPGARLVVEVVDITRPGAVLASTVVRDVAGPPIAFTLRAPRTSLAGAALRAVLQGPDGDAWFASPEPVRLASRSSGIELVLKRLDAAATAVPAASPASPAHWECGEYGLMSRVEAAGRIRLDWNGWTLRLPRAPGSGSGFADARGNGFRIDGAQAWLSLPGEPRRDCVRAARVSPWNEATLRGAALRAVGSEPGWFLDVAGSPPRLRATLDYGERMVDTRLSAVSDGFEGIGAGRPVRLHIAAHPCVEGMSGQRFEATVTLTVATGTYRGCGARLQD